MIERRIENDLELTNIERADLLTARVVRLMLFTVILAGLGFVTLMVVLIDKHATSTCRCVEKANP